MTTKEQIVENWLPRYTGTAVEDFGNYILLTNFFNYVTMFAEKFGVEVKGHRASDANGDCKRYYHYQFWDGKSDGGYGDGFAFCHQSQSRTFSW